MPDYSCWQCGASLAKTPPPFGRHSSCPQCASTLHCCRMCTHYAPNRAGSCDEDRAEPPNNKEVANFCDWFRPRAGAMTGGRTHAGTDAAAAARARLDALFGDSAAPSAPTSTRPDDVLEELRRRLADPQRNKDH